MVAAHYALAILVIAAQFCAGEVVLQRFRRAANSLPFHLACCYCTGTAVLCIQMLLVGACLGEYSFWGTVLPWLVVGGIRGKRAFSRHQFQRTGPMIASIMGAALLTLGLLYIAVPATSGDPASNFSAFGRLYAYLGQVDPSAGQQLSVYGHFEYPPLIAANESLFFMIDDVAGATLLMLMFAIYGLVLIGLAGEILMRRAKGGRRVIGDAFRGGATGLA